ncbi:MAG: divalent-cation tolerance protein CutA [Thermoguttaceae bacterium]
MRDGHLQVVTTIERREDAQRIARVLVESRLAACVQVLGPIASTYRWQGKVETAEEWQCSIKTRRDCYPAVEQAIRKLHPYEVPEIVALPIVAGGADYLAWLDEQVRGNDEGRMTNDEGGGKAALPLQG